MRLSSKSVRTRLLIGASALALVMSSGAAFAQEREPITIAPQSLTTALQQFGSQTATQVMFSPALIASKKTAGVSSIADEKLALAQLLDGTGLTFRREGNVYLIEDASDPQSGSAAGEGADGTVAALIVTAQKKEENIQDVPIAISAFTEKSLQEQKIEGGFDLLKAIPNVTFSKNNFTSYNFSIRGIGTKAVSATTDPGVAVSFNNVALIQNRLFEQEYFDVERVEVLRGPQGTLYGRNATAGVINVFSAKPNLQEFSGWLKGEVGNYHSKRGSAMVNIPLVTDKLALRVAGAFTDRQGYDFNEGTHHAVNGRDLWSARATLAFRPTDKFRTELIWERFNEDDNRSRTGKQLCHRDNGPDSVGGVSTRQHNPAWQRPGYNFGDLMLPALFSQGCKAGSLYDDGAFGTPNGLALPFVFGNIGLGGDLGAIGSINGQSTGLLKPVDPYGGAMQSRDLRSITSFRDPIYRAKADVVELNLSAELPHDLTLYSQTAYDKDSVYSFQDYNRFNTGPVFQDTSQIDMPACDPVTGAACFQDLAPGGLLCDPQLGCSNTLAGFDISQAKSSQFSQEIRLQSDWDGPVNFSGGVNYTRFNVLVDYYVMYNIITAMARSLPFNVTTDITKCSRGAGLNYFINPPVDSLDPSAGCPYIDPNPVESINGNGHNYFRSKNPYKLNSAAAFGELYWKITPTIKLTAGLRYTDDRKNFIPVPTQILLSKSIFAGGTVNSGYPEDPAVKMHWGEFTGRLGLDWEPDIELTDKTLIYGFYSRGYKGGGMNPPGIGYDKRLVSEEYLGLPPGVIPDYDHPLLFETAVNYPDRFKPEFVNAFEVGSKNVLAGGALILNGSAFLYDYKDYQVSKIVDRTAVNENFDARVWGLELESVFHPSLDIALNANIGYLDTRLGKGAKSIDVMDRTAGDPNYTVVKPWVELPSNCVVPTPVAAEFALNGTSNTFPGLAGSVQQWWALCGGWTFQPATVMDSATLAPYDVANYPELNGGAGIYKNLEGKKLPNAPHWTMNLGAQYGHDILDGSWRMTVRADGYWQSQSWARVYNAVNDKLHGWYNANLSVWFERPDDDLKIELYAKNILDKTPITDAFINSDDTALTTNVFVLDPRLIGLSIKKGF